MRLLGPNAISLPLPDTPLSQVSGLSETLAKKEAEMAGMEERYKKYIEKAKSVIKTLDPKQNPSGAPEVSALKNQLQVRLTMVAELPVLTQPFCNPPLYIAVTYEQIMLCKILIKFGMS